MATPSSYKHQEVEQKWYTYWMENNFFHSEINDKPSYTIVIPPPNVTGVLHMGHMLNNTIQDVLIRRARLKGYNACWVPGTDHASIATEAKVVAKLKAEGIKKTDLSRDEFLKHAWDWTHDYGGQILSQLKRLGASCDWDRLKFTMDDDMYDSVIQVFIDLYNKGLIYKGYRMVNWDPEAKTTLSDEEVIYEEQQGQLYYVKYPIVDSDEVLTIATTRPETIFGDTAICINHHDERFKHLKGKKAVVPIVNREIPIIFDDYVDMEFGTGCLKITPAHDENDKLIGENHNLEIIDIFNDDATLNAYGLEYEGQDRFEARKAFAQALSKNKYLIKTEDYTNKIGLSERTKAVIEPKLSEQWFLKMKDLAQPALEAVMKDESVKLFPSKFKNTYKHWLENVRDWNISRQLWWGHQIPAYYLKTKDGVDRTKFVVAKSHDEALKLAQDKFEKPDLTVKDLIQDEDSLDTWFSSWLWPMSVFDGIRHPDNEEFKYYYPTKDLVTGPDILFFWVARMIMAGYEFADQKPFDNVYLTGLVRDKQRRKMSKSLGNSPDAIGLIDEFGADGVRVGLLLSSAAGNDLLFDEALCQQGKSFANKIWNAHRLIESWKVNPDLPQSNYAKIGLEWYKYRLQQALEEIEDHYSKYRISDVLMTSYKLVWNDFCSWLLEILKPAYQQPIDAKTKSACIQLFEDNLKLLHPFMPFITEELWQNIKKRKSDEALIISQWPKQEDFDKDIIENFEITKEIITQIRSVRKSKNIPFKTAIDLKVENKENFTKDFDTIIKKLGQVSDLSYVKEQQEGTLSFSVKSNVYYIPVEGAIDVEEEKEKLQKDLEYYQGFLNSVEKKLSNKRFVDNAPKQVVDKEKQKQADALAKIETLKESLHALEK
ncbi:valine--tRNA ligase [Mesohalobacter halotolerans]|uniref:Valine--tRNA ligase n=1 Tax=Mesohalobacter halotolerans TaxID=1883405 RepID=A0A4U5TT29_9FLAO|nr:valine--tRNA ligase [Mesohalobacter halotolerans]MBS3738755.1 valine--tRNA ligase [Psychroflexus sp.]TKS56438.1 valine--tRNA ligase [Mesohalobacter halotolerans]